MKAIIYEKYGTPEVLQFKEVLMPIPKPNEVLIKVHASSINASDGEFLTGSPFYVRFWGPLKPKYKILGSDVSGVVETVGNKVKQFKVGDEVFGDIMYHWGAFAEYVCATEKEIIQKPANVSFDEAATLPQAALVAYQALKYKSKIQPGQSVLINGAAGGSGTFAIQIAKMLGAEVTGVDNAEKFKTMNNLGADSVIDYKRNDFTRNKEQYDLILDFIASHPIRHYSRSLKTNGQYLMVGGGFRSIFQTLVPGGIISLFTKKKLSILGAVPNLYLKELAQLVESKKIKPIIDTTFSLSQLPEAFDYLLAGHAKGKIVIHIE